MYCGILPPLSIATHCTRRASSPTTLLPSTMCLGSTPCCTTAVRLVPLTSRRLCWRQFTAWGELVRRGGTVSNAVCDDGGIDTSVCVCVCVQYCTYVCTCGWACVACTHVYACVQVCVHVYYICMYVSVCACVAVLSLLHVQYACMCVRVCGCVLSLLHVHRCWYHHQLLHAETSGMDEWIIKYST